MDARLLSKIKRIIDPIRPRGFKIFMFGSRVRGDNRRYSDIDLGIEGKDRLPIKNHLDLVSAFEDSDLPFKVGIVDFTTVTDKFKLKAKENIIEI
ncbi:hypothetical protein COY48_01440 [Candidatus Collierbacteria bacterium CG_4_10_14_0_8_um_filter_43_86]|uniref:Polymerase nucleotidyl transferase domain-containing protein n=1 Tax=Candidatus Collierbacteria bacterium CG_4_9_14_3_um_filter_43_16 TaxID=1974532 RepID=A0A2M8BTQ5_9BACT|nr:MAG: hypothetical protein COY48_01440 [Candidatus Collierbacteria bacterium CG_4_10_14_0_8_um_filter_43_86]PJB47181.1 MAG: hypothetical protein CO104_04205 [Candidatus Collierbacteria bacterium CG_4_9_14_3_um_filter_43_16]